jgi:hypothetical protein
MASRLNISVSEAREIVLEVSRENGWHEPELEATTDPRILASIAHLRRQVADAVETSVIWFFFIRFILANSH